MLRKKRGRRAADFSANAALELEVETRTDVLDSMRVTRGAQPLEASYNAW